MQKKPTDHVGQTWECCGCGVAPAPVCRDGRCGYCGSPILTEEEVRKHWPEAFWPEKILWVSRHDLSPAQLAAIRSLHGEGVEVVKDPVVFSNTDGLADYIRNHVDSFVYAVAGAPHYITAALAGLHFGVFENHPQKRQDGSFGLAAVYHVDGSLKKVWVNPDPGSDKGEALIAVVHST